MKTKSENELYFRMQFRGYEGMLTLYEKKRLSPKQYHPLYSTHTNFYQKVVEKEEVIGKRIPSMQLFPEVYKNYGLERVDYPVCNDFMLDGFEYDQKREIVTYASIYGVYAIRKEGAYYEVITGEEVKDYVVGSVLEVTTPKEMQEMLEDLNAIAKKKEIYVSILREILFYLEEGEKNKNLALKRYTQNYAILKREQEEKWIEKQVKSQNMQQKFSITPSFPKEKVKELIYKIRNDVL